MHSLHIGEGKCTGYNKPFDENKWEKIKSTITKRSQWQKKTKYDDLLQNIPEQNSETQGYHSKCYKNFTAIPADVPYVTHINLSPASALTNEKERVQFLPLLHLVFFHHCVYSVVLIAKR